MLYYVPYSTLLLKVAGSVMLLPTVLEVSDLRGENEQVPLRKIALTQDIVFLWNYMRVILLFPVTFSDTGQQSQPP